MVPTMDSTNTPTNLPANIPLTSCPHCAAQMPNTAGFCPGCGRPMQTETRAHGTVGILPENIAGGVAYVTFIPAIVFLLLEPYKENRFVRFLSLIRIKLWVLRISNEEIKRESTRRVFIS